MSTMVVAAKEGDRVVAKRLNVDEVCLLVWILLNLKKRM